MDQKTSKGRLLFLKKKRFFIPGVTLLILLTFLLLLPVGTKYYLQKWLIDNGADSATIERVRLNPITGIAALEGVEINKDGKTVFSNSTIFINIGLQQLFSKEARLQGAQFSDIVIEIEKADDGGLRIGSFSLSDGGTSSEEKSKEEVHQEVKESLGWIFNAEVVSIKNVTVHYKSSEIDSTLFVEEAIITSFNTDPNRKQGALSFKGSLNGAPIFIELSRISVLPVVEIIGNVDISQLSLGDFEKILGGYVSPFQGDAGLKGKLRFAMEQEKGIDLQYDGKIHLVDGVIGGTGWGTKGTVGWGGKVQFSMKEETMVVTTDGDLKAQAARFDLDQPVINVSDPEILISGRTQVTIGEEVVVDTNASLTIDPLLYVMEIMKSSTGPSKWAGKIRVETGTPSKGLAVRAEGKLDVGETRYSMGVGPGEMTVANSALSYDGDFEYLAGTGQETVSSIRTNGVLAGDLTAFEIPEVVEVKQEKFDFRGKTEIALGDNVEVIFDGDVVLSDTDVALPAVEVSDKQVSWSGIATFSSGTEEQKVGFKGSLEVQGLLTNLKNAGTILSQGVLTGDTDFILNLSENISILGTLGVTGKELNVQKDKSDLITVSNFALIGVEGDGTPGVKLAEFTINDVTVPSSEIVPVEISVESVELIGLETMDFESGQLDKFLILRPNVRDPQSETTLAALDNITIEDIRIGDNFSTRVGSFVGSQGRFLSEGDGDPLAQLKSVNVQGLQYSNDEGVLIQAINLDSLVSVYTLKQSESEEKGKATSPPKEEPSHTGGKEEATPKGIPVNIQQIKLGGESSFAFTDTTHSEPFSTTLEIEKLLLENIDLNKPEQPFSYQLNGTFNKYAPLKITGNVAPLAKEMAIDQEVSLKNYSLTHVSPYLVDAIGTYFVNGRLDYSSTMKINGNKIDMKNNLRLKDVDSETIEGEISGKFHNQLPVPLDMAFSMLKDNDGAIDLDVPISGELSELNIGLGDLIVTTLGKGISLAVAPYLAYVFLGPTGALVYAGAKVGQALINTDLPSLEFQVKSTELTEEHVAKLAKIGEAIKKDAEKPYSICSKVSVSELDDYETLKGTPFTRAQKEEFGKVLFKLGETRSLTVKNYLIENFDIEDERLLICDPGVDFKGSEKPRVEFKH